MPVSVQADVAGYNDYADCIGLCSAVVDLVLVLSQEEALLLVRRAIGSAQMQDVLLVLVFDPEQIYLITVDTINSLHWGNGDPSGLSPWVFNFFRL